MGWWWENVSVSIVFARPKKCNISSLWLVMDQTLLGKPQHVVCTVCIPHANKNNIYCNNRVKKQSHSTCTIPFILFMIHTENKHLYWFYSPFYESSLLPVALNTLDNFIACLASSDIFSVIPIVFPAPSLSVILRLPFLLPDSSYFLLPLCLCPFNIHHAVNFPSSRLQAREGHLAVWTTRMWQNADGQADWQDAQRPRAEGRQRPRDPEQVRGRVWG